MIGYVTVGTTNLPRATAFYDELLGLIGAKRLMSFDRGHAWGKDMASPSFGVFKPFDGKPASIGNGCMTAFVLASRELVDQIYARALALGGTDEGGPGERSPGFYAAYFRDLDGNKLNAFCMG